MNFHFDDFLFKSTYMLIRQGEVFHTSQEIFFSPVVDKLHLRYSFVCQEMTQPKRIVLILKKKVQMELFTCCSQPFGFGFAFFLPPNPNSFPKVI